MVAAENITYLTGYETIGYSNFGVLAVRQEGDPLLFIREMERTVAETTTWLRDFEIFADDQDPLEQAVTALRKRGWLDGRVGVELGESFVSPGTMDRFRRLLGPTVDGTGLVEAGRAIKSAEEIALIRQACRITEAGAIAALDAIRPGRHRERGLQRRLRGDDGAGLRLLRGRPDRDLGVAVGGRAPHVRQPAPRAGRHDPARAERVSPAVLRPAHAGRRHRRRCATRCAGCPTSSSTRCNAAIAAIRPGVTSGAVDAACREPIERAGFEPNFRKRTGYSVGVGYAPSWGEGHIVSLRRDDPTRLEPGMVFHMPPALRVPRQYGLGFSETVLVTPTGCEVLTNHPRRLHVVGG